MKIIVSSDRHIDRTKVESDLVRGWNVEAGVQSNWVEAYKQNDQVIDIVNEYQPDYWLDAGDVFDEGNPIPEAVDRLLKSHQKLNKHTKVLISGGNHDQRGVVQNQATPIEAYLSDQKWCALAANETTVYDADGFNFVCVPWHKVAGTSMLDTTSHTLTQEIEDIAASIKGPSVLFGHFVNSDMTFGSAKRGAETMMGNPLEATIDTSVLDKGPWSLWYEGHIHKQQRVTDKGVIVGSTYKVSFKERDETKGVYYAELDDTTGEVIENRFIPLEGVRNLHQFDLTDGGRLTQTMVDEINNNDVVRFILEIDQKLTPSQSNKFSELEKLGVQVQKTYLPRVRHEMPSQRIAMDTNPANAYRMYSNIALKDENPDMIPKVNEAFDDILHVAGEVS